jgi:hypothetical protein
MAVTGGGGMLSCSMCHKGVREFGSRIWKGSRKETKQLCKFRCSEVIEASTEKDD